MSGIVNSTGAKSGIIGTTVGTPSASSGGGKVLQVVSTVKTSNFNVSGTGSWHDVTGLAVAITPASSSNKILLTGALAISINTTDTRNVMWKVVGGNTASYIGDASSTRVRSLGTHFWAASNLGSNKWLSQEAVNYLDSPSSTTEVTYQVQLWIPETGTAYVGYTDDDSGSHGATAPSTLTAMEIAA